jgi:hypothetical protein
LPRLKVLGQGYKRLKYEKSAILGIKKSFLLLKQKGRKKYTPTNIALKAKLVGM